MNNAFAPASRVTRTYGRNISGLTGEERLNAAGLNWKVVPRPIATIGASRNVPIEGYKALMRSDIRDGEPQPLSIASDKYVPFQNAQILDMMAHAAEAVGLQLDRADSYDEGRKIWAMTDAGSINKAEVGLGDVISLKFRMTSGHIPGTALRFQALVERLRCFNGATSKHVEQALAIGHRRSLTQTDLENLRRVYTEAGAGFRTFLKDARNLAQTPATQQESRLIVAELLGQDILDEAVAKTLSGFQVNRTGNRAEGLYEAAKEMARLNRRLTYGESASTRHQNIIADIIAETEHRQVGADLVRGNLWGTYNGITSYYNHLAGRSVDSGLESAFNGQNGKTMSKAYDLVTAYAEAKNRG